MKGKHFILDVKCEEKEKLVDTDLMYKILTELPEIVNMKRLTEPIIVGGAPITPD